MAEDNKIWMLPENKIGKLSQLIRHGENKIRKGQVQHTGNSPYGIFG
jgi:hypothetical protein